MARAAGLTFRAKLLASHVGLVVVVVLIAILDLNRTLSDDLRAQLDERLEQQARGAAVWIGEGRRHPDKLAGRVSLIVDAQVTIFDREGAVVGDSRPEPTGEPSGAPPEVGAARSSGVGRAQRAVPGAGEHLFVAVPAADGLIVRLGAPLSKIQATVSGMRTRLLVAAAIALAAALALALVASRVVARPLRAMTRAATRITAGDYDIDVGPKTADDFGVLSGALETLARQLAARIGDLTTERDRLSAILEGMDEGVLVLDAERRVALANRAAHAILRAERGALLDQPLEAAIPWPALRAHIEERATTAGPGDASELDVDAGDASITVYVRPLAAAPKGGVVVVVRDMTRVKKLLSLRRDFVANVSHELRTPVAAIQGYAETLIDGERLDAATSRQFLEIIHRQSARIAALVDDLLHLSQLEARPEGDARRERVEIAPVVADVAETVAARARAAEISLALDLEPGAAAFGEPDGIERILLNLVDNALKYGSRGGRVKVTARREGARVAVRVEDDGPGIEPIHLPRLFERFYRVDAGRSRERGGTGLGLAIVKHIVESMGGAVRVESTLGRGTTFTVDLPAA